jgi:hypothetical protein
MSRRREPTQRERVARALSYFGRTSALDWHDATIDNRPPIWNLPARIDELRRAGWLIDSQDRDRNRLAIYRLREAMCPRRELARPGRGAPVRGDGRGSDAPEPVRREGRGVSVRDKRPAFTWVTNASLGLIRRTLASGQQLAARNALLALAEAASRRRDGEHREGDTLAELAALAGTSERRLRPHLRELEALGLIQISEEKDERGGDRPTIYTLLDGGSDDSSDRGDAASGGSDELASRRPTLRARPDGVELQEEQPPQPPHAGEATFPDKPDCYRDQGRKRQVDVAFDEEATAFARRHFPGISEGYVRHHAVDLRSRGKQPTVEALRPLVEQHRPRLEAIA